MKAASSARGAVISCGGGVVLNPENMARLKESSVVVYLKASPRALLARVGHSRRPLLRGGDRLSIITTLMGQRASLYEQAADIAIDTSNMGVAGVVDAIMAALSQP